MRRFLHQFKVQHFPHPTIGIVEKTISYQKSGRIEALGSHYPAKFYRNNITLTLDPGEPVQIVGRQGITLLVIPL